MWFVDLAWLGFPQVCNDFSCKLRDGTMRLKPAVGGGGVMIGKGMRRIK